MSGFIINPYVFAAFSPSDITGLVLWLDASDTDTITHDLGAVSQWDDKSTNSYAFVQTTGSAQPTTGSSTINSLNVLSFASGDWLKADTTRTPWLFLQDGSEYTVFVVVAPTSSTATEVLLATESSIAGDGWRIINTSGRHQLTVRVSGGMVAVVNDTSGTVSTSPTIVTMLGDTDNATAADRSAIRVNGGTGVTNNTFTDTPTSGSASLPLHVGSRAGSGLYYVGSFAEALIYDSKLATSDVENVEVYLAAKWGITI